MKCPYCGKEGAYCIDNEGAANAQVYLELTKRIEYLEQAILAILFLQEHIPQEHMCSTMLSVNEMLKAVLNESRKQ